MRIPSDLCTLPQEGLQSAVGITVVVLFVLILVLIVLILVVVLIVLILIVVLIVVLVVVLVLVLVVLIVVLHDNALLFVIEITKAVCAASDVFIHTVGLIPKRYLGF